MEFLSNLSQNQLIGICAAIVLIVVLAIILYRRKQDYEETKKEEMFENGKVVVANFKENIKGKHMNTKPTRGMIIPEKLIDGPLYTMVKTNQNMNFVITTNGDSYPVSSIYYDDVDLWFVAQTQPNLSIIVVKSPDGTILQYSYEGVPKDLPNLDPSQLMGFKEPNILVLANGNDLNKSVDPDVQELFYYYGKNIIPILTNQDVQDFQKIKVDVKSLVYSLSQNEIAFRRYIRNARLKLREMERQGNMLNHDQKMELINNSILQFLLDKNVVNNFDQASRVIQSIDFNNIKNSYPEKNCNMNSENINKMKTIADILSTYSEMLSRLFSATIVNSQKYMQYCNKNPELTQSYEIIINSLKNIVSSKDFANKFCPQVQCPKVQCPQVRCPQVRCPACPRCPSVETKPIISKK
jgi:hypothetical protein